MFFGGLLEDITVLKQVRIWLMKIAPLVFASKHVELGNNDLIRFPFDSAFKLVDLFFCVCRCVASQRRLLK